MVMFRISKFSKKLSANNAAYCSFSSHLWNNLNSNINNNQYKKSDWKIKKLLAYS